MEARKLNLVNINDEVRFGGEWKHYFNIRNITSYLELQKLILNEKRLLIADILAIDIDMHKKPLSHGEGLFWSKDSSAEVRPYGPLLALPFLGSGRLTSFTPYSEKWRDKNVLNCGYTMLGISFLLSAEEKRNVSLNEVPEILSKKQYLDSGAFDAIRTVLANYRNSIFEDSSVVIQNLHKTRDCLDNQDDEGLAEGVLLDDFGRNLSISLIYGEHLDKIYITSLFADFLGPCKSIDRKDLNKITETLDHWASNIPGERVDDIEEEDFYHAAYERYLQCKDKPLALRGTDKRIIRTVILFAWVEAWADFISLNFHDKHKLNPIEDGYTELQIKARRKELLDSVTKRIGVWMGENKSRETTRKYNRLFGDDKSRATLRTLTPDAIGEGDEVERYCLYFGEDRAVDVNGFERQMCRDFVKEHIEVNDKSSSPYRPHWIK